MTELTDAAFPWGWPDWGRPRATLITSEPHPRGGRLVTAEVQIGAALDLRVRVQFQIAGDASPAFARNGAILAAIDALRGATDHLDGLALDFEREAEKIETVWADDWAAK